MQLKMNCSEQSIMQLELFPDLVCRKSLKKQLKTSTRKQSSKQSSGLLPVSDRVSFCDELIERCRAYGHCASISALTALCCLFQEVQTYTKEQFIIDIQPYL